MTTAQLSGHAVVPWVVIEEFEGGGAPLSEADVAALRRALEAAGVEFTNDGQPGVRPKNLNTGTIPIDQLNASNDE
jgi:hypothetical protein